MARPTKIDILGIPVRIIQVKKIDKDDAYGESNFMDRTIKIRAGLPEDLFESTLLHEIVHTILGMTGQSEHLKHEQEEAIVLALEHGLCQIYGRFLK